MKKILFILLVLLCVSYGGQEADAKAYITEVADAAALAQLADDVNSGIDYSGNTVLLTADITLQNDWTPIGDYQTHWSGGQDGYTIVDVDHAFNGTFDGGGHTITLELSTETVKNYSIFAYLGVNGKVKDLQTTGSISSSAFSSVGAIAAKCMGTVDYCRNSASVSGRAAGGIVGWQEEGSEIRNCTNNGEIYSNGNYAAGGIVGHSDASIKNCVNSGNITSGESTGNANGGIAGYAFGNVENCYSTGTITGADYNGIIAGSLASTGDDGILKNCYCPKTLIDTGLTTTDNQGDGTITGCDSKTDVELKSAEFQTLLNSNLSTSEFFDWLVNTSGYFVPKYVDPVSFDGGDGTNKENAYIINTPEQLLKLANDVSGEIDYANKYFKLGRDIDLSGVNWKPIGNSGDESSWSFKGTEFEGYFDGANYTISNFSVSAGNTNFKYQGLFGCIGENGIVTGVKIANANIYGNGYCGVVAGKNLGIIRNCTASVDSSINATLYMGGIAGNNSGGTVINCCNHANITSNNDWDGLTAHSGGVAGGGGNVKNCYNVGTVKFDVGSESSWGEISSNNSGVQYCYFDEADSSNNGSGSGTAISNAVMRSTLADTLNANLDEIADGTLYLWAQGEDDYPYLTNTLWTVQDMSNEVSANDVTVVYDGNPHDISVVAPTGATVSYGSSEGTYNLGMSPTITNVTESPKTVYYKVSKAGYSDVTGSATITIDKKTLTITAKNHSIVYGDAPENNGVSYSGFAGTENANVLGGTLGYTYNYEAGGNVGVYSIIPEGLASVNYNINFSSGNLTVSPKMVNVLVSGQSSVNYETDYSHTATYTDVNGQNASAIILYDSAADNDDIPAEIKPELPGEYNITAKTGSNNYVVNGYSPESISSFAINKTQLSSPVFSVEGGEYSEAKTLTLICAVNDARIYYKIEYNNTTVNWTQYTNPIDIDENATISAYSSKDNYHNSSEVQQRYTFRIPRVNAVAFDNPPAEMYRGDSSELSYSIDCEYLAENQMGITWDIKSEHLSGTYFDGDTLYVDRHETANKIKIRLTSDFDNSKFAEKEINLINPKYSGSSNIPAIENVINGTSIDNIVLPHTVKITTNLPLQEYAFITWNTENVDYDQNDLSEQEFTVNGIISLPEHTDRNENSLDVQVAVHVNASGSNQETPTGGVSGTVTNSESKTVKDVIVKLTKGGTVATPLSETLTDLNGNYAFVNIPDGVYSLVAVNDEQRVTKTIIIDSQKIEQNLVLPNEKLNTTLEVLDGTPAVAVNNLEAVIDEPEKTTEIVLVVEKKTENEAIGKEEILTKLEGREHVAVYLDAKLLKSEEGNEPQEIQPKHGSKVKITIDVPEAFWGNSSYSIIRHHGDSAEKLPCTYNKKLHTITFETDRFSTYALVYEKASVYNPLPPVPPVTKNPFDDISESDWFYDDVIYTYENNLINGTEPNKFSPYSSTSRSMITTILWRLEGEPKASTSSDFEDLTAGAYYVEAINWAKENGIVKGYNEVVFAPNDDITREQTVAILYRYSQYKGEDVSGREIDLDAYSDKSDVSDYAVNAINWALSSEIIKGRNEDEIGPKESALRCEFVAMLVRYKQK